jgi:hypothetical protein
MNLSPAEAAALVRELLATHIRFERGARGPRAPRFYTLHLVPSSMVSPKQVHMFDEPGWSLVVTRGRLDGKRRPVVLVHRFATLARAMEKFGVLCARRRHRGYAEQEQQA